MAVNVPLPAPAAMFKLAGTVTLALLLDRATFAPAAGAAALSVTVHAEEPGATTLEGLQVSPLTVRVGEMFRTKV